MKIVIALGGNALGIDPKEQKENAYLTAQTIKDIILNNQVVITHGNGPQVGLINLAFTEGNKVNQKVYEMPFVECGAMSQGYIGYHLVNSLDNVLNSRNSVGVMTHVLVDKNDPAFQNPTKPIGSFYTKEEAEKMPYTMKEDSGRGYRRVIASPKPIDILEFAQIESLINAGFTVVCTGGGGIPVIEENNKILGIDAVIDKDNASSLLASKLKADKFIILTAVPNAKINFGKENEQDLGVITYDEAKLHLANNEFKEGSMKPKILSCLDFLDKNPNGEAVVTDANHLEQALKGLAGTIIKR